MTILFANRKGPIRWPATDAHDPSSKRFYRIDYAPPVWTSNTPVVKEVNVVLPTSDNGCMYQCASSGKTGAVEPTWATVEDGTITDNDVSWTCMPKDTELKSGDTITASTWAGDTGCTFDNEAIMDGIATKARLTAVPEGADSVTITNHVTVVRNNGDTEELETSITIRVAST